MRVARVNSTRSGVWLIGVQVAAAFFLVTCTAFASRGSAGESLGDISENGDGELVFASLGILVALTLPVLVTLALAFSAAMLQLSLGLTNTELAYRRCLRAVLLGSVPFAMRNVALGVVIVAIDTETAVRLIRYGDPFILAAAALLYFHLRSIHDVGRLSALFACFFTFGFPLALQIILGLV